MKKLLSLVLSLTLAMAVLAGCGGASETSTTVSTAASTEANATVSTATSTTPSTDANGDSVKTGLAVVSSIAKSTDAGEKDGLAEVDSIIAAVTVDKDGKIVKCAIDAAQTKINFSAAGKIVTDLKAEFKSKQELGTEYGLKAASGIAKEWNEQADAFAAYVVGKTVAEVKGIAVTAEGVTSDKELATSVTVKIGDFIAVTEKAVSGAQDLGAKAGDKLGLGVNTNIAGSLDVADKDGLAQAYSYYTATTSGADSKITSCVIDASQSNVNFSKVGKVTSDLKAALKTKDELGTEYGMLKVSKIKKEWNEQATAFAAYVVGKTVDEVKGIAINADGAPTISELTSSVTVHISDFTATIEKANAKAK
ncbi:MAG TPA: hypothetical protein VIK78_13065 [Ruminiclostridium sp.]